MNAAARFDNYLNAFRQRLRRLTQVRAAAAITLIILVVSTLGAFVAVRSGFAGDTVMLARLLLLVLIACTVYGLLLQPLRQIRDRAGVLIERRTPAFAGRIKTFLGIHANDNPLTELLAEDSLSVAEHHPVGHQFRRIEFALPSLVTVLSLIVLIWLMLAGPGLMKYGVRHLLAGWAVPGLLPPQTISVSPGDDAVRRGGSLRVTAATSGFAPESATIHARFGESDWQDVQMAGTDGGGYEFTFFSIREPVSYYVSAADIRSPEFQIQVVDLPEIESLKLVYHYPGWVQREPEIEQPGGDINALAGTEIELEMTTDAPLQQGELVLNETTVTLDQEGRVGRARFTVSDDGQYYLAARVGGDQVRLSDDYFIRVLEDAKPEVKLVRPGRDWGASNIEEVTVGVEAIDDYDLESLELRYSVNGGDWQSVPLDNTGRETRVDHVFYLESMQYQDPDDATGKPGGGLLPGDLISYYAVATDRQQTSRTDMFFIDVQPFYRRFMQSQQAGGGGGRGQPQQEISNRQKEIIVSTWNLIREQTGQRGPGAGQSIGDNATLLSELQTTLAGQARTLAERAHARQLSEEDEQIATFVEHLELAAGAMAPAAERLAAVELEDAILPEQEALQHLLRAEAVFNDVNVSMQRNNRGGRGSRAGSDLAEMFELEMDLEKNQYETGSRASPEPLAQEQDEAMRKLEELSRRQQQLADNMQRQRNLSAAQRWQQEMLRREAEELQRQLEEMQQQMASSSGGGRSQSQSGNQGQSSRSAEAARSELSRRLDSAIRAMNEAARNMRDSSDPEQMQRAAREAQRQLQGARDQVARARQESMQGSFRSMQERAEQLYRQQAGIDEELQEAVRRALEAREKSGQLESGLDPMREAQLAGEKQEMSAELQKLLQDMQRSTKQYEATAPGAVRELEDATRKLREAEIDTRLSVASEYIRMGAAAYIASSESAVTNTLRQVKDDLQRARNLARGEGEGTESQLDQAIARTRELRREMQQLQNSGANPARDGDTTAAAGGADGWRAAFNAPPPELRGRLERNINDTARAVWSVMPELQRRGVSAGVQDELRRIASLLDMSKFSRNNQILEREYNSVLTLLEQLELQLVEGTRSDRSTAVRSAVPEEIPGEYQDAVAEYYRRLSREE